MTEPIISVSGLRGIVGESLTPEIAIRYATALAAVAPPGPIVLARDSRPSGRMLAGAINSGLEAVGRSTINAGICATPTTGVLVRRLGAAGGIQITASHNPSPYNGFKLFSAEGRVIPARLGEEVLQQYRTGRPAWVAHERIGSGETIPDTLSDHLSLVLEIVQPERIRERRFRVLLDANHGAGGRLGRRLLEELGCTVTILGEEPDGQFAHISRADDRKPRRRMLVRDRGRGRHRLLPGSGRRSPGGHRCRRTLYRRGIHDCPLRRACPPACGRANRHQLLKQPHDPRSGRTGRCSVFPIGRGRGERGRCNALQSGNLRRRRQWRPNPPARRLDPRQFRRHGIDLGRDGRARASHRDDGRRLTEIRDREVENLFAEGKDPGCVGRVESHFGDATADRMDGLRLDWPGRWLLVRGSNTEPIVRAVAEAPTAQTAAELCSDAAEVLRRI